MRSIASLFFLCIFLSPAKSQTGYDLTLLPQDFELVNNKYQYRIAIENHAVDFWTVALKSREDLSDRIEITIDSRKSILYKNGHGATEGYWLSEQLFIDGDHKEIVVTIDYLTEMPLELRLFTAFFTGQENTAIKIQPSRAACPCPQPFYFDREGWCPGGYCPEHPDPTFTTVTHLIVHHAASTNISVNWSLVVQSIWDYHVNNNGWDDIGYNWLIDPNGNVYEGRGDNIQGAHFCGTNSNTAGICMLGEFTNQLPTPQAIAGLTALLAWKSCDVSIDPTAASFHSSSNLQLPHIAGHRDGCATECPGNSFYPTIPELRLAVQDQIEFTCANLPAPSNLTATTTTTSSITLDWMDNALEETAFLLERSAWTNEQYEQIAIIDQNLTTYLDKSLQANSVYFYRIRATNEIDTTDYSNEVGISTVVQSTNDIAAANINVFPNPVIDYLNIEIEQLDKIKKLAIYDVLGQTIWSQTEMSGELININTASWSGGIYYIHFGFSEKNIFHPILIQ